MDLENLNVKANGRRFFHQIHDHCSWNDRLGIGIKKYLKKSGIADSRRILGLGVFWLKFSGNALLIIGTFFLLTVGVTFYYFLKSEGII
jgi:hypothetical protein